MVKWMLAFAIADLRSRLSALKVFLACLVLGVTLVAATASLYRVVSQSLLADTRALLGGDVELETNEPLPKKALEWIDVNGSFSLVREIDSLVTSASGDAFVRVEILIPDSNYPLYGQLQLTPNRPRAELTDQQADGVWGAVLDPVLAERLGQGVGDTLQIGAATFRITGLIARQPDRRLSANWRGLPVMISAAALPDTQLIRPGSRVEYEYRVKTDQNLNQWLAAFEQAFPDIRVDITTFADRSDRIAERLDQMATAFMLIAFTTLFIGGLGVANSIHAYLNEKLGTMATLQTLGLRARPLVVIYVLQIGLLGTVAGIIGGGVGLVLSEVTLHFVGETFAFPKSHGVAAWLAQWFFPLVVSWFFAVLTAYVFALPNLARALAASPAGLFRGQVEAAAQAPRKWRTASYGLVFFYGLALLLAMPSPGLGLLFLMIVLALWGLLECLIKALQLGAKALENSGFGTHNFARRLALANLHRPASPLRPTLLSLGTALTLVVACTLLVMALLRALSTTIPEQSPALILYDVLPAQKAKVISGLQSLDSTSEVTLLPLVRARLEKIDGQPLSEVLAADAEVRREAMGDEYKLSYLAGNPEGLALVEGTWWSVPAKPGEPAYMAMEDREAKELGITVGQRVQFQAQGEFIDAQIHAIYKQKGLQTRFWFEGILQKGALDSVIGRYVGAVVQNDAAAKQSQYWLAQNVPNVITLRTQDWLETAGSLLNKVATGLAAVAAVSLFASLLVLSSVVSVSRQRQIVEANIVHCLGARHQAIIRAFLVETGLLTLIATVFATVLGCLIALPIGAFALKLSALSVWWIGLLVATCISVMALVGGLLPTLKALRLNPATLLRER